MGHIMKVKEFLKQFDGFNPELEVGIFEGGDLFRSNIGVQMVKVELVRPDTYIKSFSANGDYKNVIVISE